MIRRGLLLLAALAPLQAAAASSDLSYEAYVDSDRRIKCLYGYAAEKTGDHDVAIRIFEDCVRRWNDVYSMIWLAQIYETGVGAPRDLARATALLRRGAESDDEAGYSTLARYHYGIALIEGRGVARDPAEGERWLRRAAAEGVAEAQQQLRRAPAADQDLSPGPGR